MIGVLASWVLAAISCVLGGAAFLLATVREINRCTDEERHYRLSIRFWMVLAALGALLVVVFAMPLLAHRWASAEIGLVSAGLVCVLPTVVIVAGLRNAGALWLAQRRRRAALRHGVVVHGRIVDRWRRTLAHDLMALSVEVELPENEPRSELAYRDRGARAARCRLVEVCPGDHWARFEPGQAVSVRVDPAEPRRFALLLFERP
jgi:hypothetical protein